MTLAGSLRAPGLADATRQDGSAVLVAGRPITRSFQVGRTLGLPAVPVREISP
jgi:hypothetical protein